MHFPPNIIAVLCVLLHLTDQASSLTCFSCESETRGGEDCYESPNRREFEKDCPAMVHPKKNLRDILVAYQIPEKDINEAIAAIPDGPFRMYPECWKMTFIKNGEQYIRRGCGTQLVTDEFPKEISEFNGAKFKSLYRCNTDKCNSSDTLKMGFFNLTLSLLIVFFH